MDAYSVVVDAWDYCVVHVWDYSVNICSGSCLGLLWGFYGVAVNIGDSSVCYFSVVVDVWDSFVGLFQYRNVCLERLFWTPGDVNFFGFSLEKSVRATWNLNVD